MYTFICQGCGTDLYSAAKRPKSLKCPICGDDIKLKEEIGFDENDICDSINP